MARLRRVRKTPRPSRLNSALLLLAIALIGGFTMGVMRVRGTLALPIPVTLIHGAMVLSAVIMILLAMR